MEGVRGTEAGGNAHRLSQLYSNAKQSYRSAIPSATANDVPELQSANRKFRMQKDRLMAWACEWSDNGSALSEHDIGKTLVKAGLTEVVADVMESIISMIDEVDKVKLRIRPVQSQPAGFPIEKSRWDSSDITHYGDLINDMTKAVDLLYSLSPSRKSRQGAAGATHANLQGADISALSDYEASKASEELAKQLQAQEDPSSATSQKIDRSLLIMPEEASPPYDSFGMPCPVQIVGRMRTKAPYRDFKGQEHYEATAPVLVEYARFDPIYRGNSIPLPFTRLNQLSNILASSVAKRPGPLLKFVGYFEDTTFPRVGLIYELPQWAQSVYFNQPASVMKPESLHALLQAAAQAIPTPTFPVVNPALEDRFILANELVTGFSYLLDRGFMHKDVNSTSVTFFPGPSNQQLLAKANSGKPYLVRKPVICAFDLFSEYDIDRERENLHQNMYRHPDDPRIKGPATSEEYQPRFDMYSLALLLLEIGLWAPLAKMFKVKYSLRDFSLRLKKIYIPRLASECGTVYMRAVQEMMDVSSNDQLPAHAQKDAFGRITARLRKCCLLDEADSEDEPPAAYSPVERDTPQMFTYRLSEKHPIPGSTELTEPSRRSSALIPSLPLAKPRSAPFETDTVAQPSTSRAPPGAWPQAPVFPEFEITGLGSGAIVKRAFRPPRYLFPQCPVLKAVVQEAYRIEKRLCKIGELIFDPQETANISLDGFGASESLAKPTFCVMCTSTAKFYKAVKKNLAFDNNVFDLIIFKGAVTRSKAFSRQASARRASAVPRRSCADARATEPKNTDHHIRPLCGASIGAFKDFEHLPPVSFGGVIMVDGIPYGMSVHHMLEAPEAGEDPESQEEEAEEIVPKLVPGGIQRSMAARNSSVDTLADYLEGYEEDDDDEDTLSDISDAETITFSDIEDDDDESSTLRPEMPREGYPAFPVPNFAEGDTPGVQTIHGGDITITQPALDDIPEDFFPVEDDKDEDHLTSHSFGTVHASSGLRRLTHNGVEHEIDWALMNLDRSRLQPHNVIAGGRRHCSVSRSPSSGAHTNHSDSAKTDVPPLLEPVCRKPYAVDEDHYPVHFLPTDSLANLSVHSVGRTSGLATGKTGSFMEFVKMAGRRTWSESWAIRSIPVRGASPLGAPDEKMGVPGDSGAWVVDNDSGKVCGHVLAFSQAKQCAYIAPMEVLLHDIKNTMQADSVTLPGFEVAINNHVYHSAMAAGSQSLVRSPSLNEELTRLRAEGREGDRSQRLMAQHFSISGKQSHMEREWTSRRRTLGMECRAGG
ncbi:MAG: hypothetical protein Q9162_002902 [Coniocarpon cinnabarinum]